MNINKISLKDFLERIKELPDNYDFYFSGQGDGTVKAFVEGTFIVNKNKVDNKI